MVVGEKKDGRLSGVRRRVWWWEWYCLWWWWGGFVDERGFFVDERGGGLDEGFLAVWWWVCDACCGMCFGGRLVVKECKC